MLDALLDLAEKGCADLTALQQEALAAMTQVFLASRNAKKLAEMRRILAEHVPDVEVLGLDDVAPYDEPAETEPTFEGNALLKARAGRRGHRAAVARRRQRALRRRAQRHARRAVGALGRAPPRTTPANNQLLLDQLADVPDERRGAQFRCAVAFAYPVGAGGVAEHVVRRRDARPGDPRAAGRAAASATTCCSSPTGDDRTSAELPSEEKDAISPPRQGAARDRARRADVLVGRELRLGVRPGVRTRRRTRDLVRPGLRGVPGRTPGRRCLDGDDDLAGVWTPVPGARRRSSSGMRRRRRGASRRPRARPARRARARDARTRRSAELDHRVGLDHRGDPPHVLDLLGCVGEGLAADEVEHGVHGRRAAR